MAKKAARTNGNGTDPNGADPASDGALPAPAQPIVDINSAGVDELRRLRGIGRALAERIVQYRAANGPFAAPADLARVPGVNPATVESILPQLTASAPAEPEPPTTAE